MRAMKRKLSLIVIILYLTSVLAGCGLGQSLYPFEHNIDGGIGSIEQDDDEPEIPAPKRGGELIIPIPVPDTFNPLLTRSRDMINFFGLIFEGLFEYDENMRPQPCLVESWEVDEEGKLWRFHLRKDIKFHDGSILTGEDVVFTFIALQQGNLNSFFQKGIVGNDNIQKVEVDLFDIYTINVHLLTPANNILDIMTFPVLPKEIYQSDAYMLQKKEDTGLIPVGTGPYRVDEVMMDDGYIRLVRNSEWWGKQPYIDSILAKIYRDEMQVRQAFRNGEVDLLDITSAITNPYLLDDSTRNYRYLTRNYEFLAFNLNHSILGDVNIRKAIAYALQRKDIIFRVYLNNAEAVDVPIPSDSWLYDGNTRIYDFEQEKAIKLLEEAGWTDSDGDGIREKDFDSKTVELKFTIMTNAENSIRKDVVELIAQQLQEIGIGVQSRIVPWEEFETSLMDGNFEIVLTGYYLDIFPDLDFIFHSKFIGDGLNNFIRNRDEELDMLLDEAAGIYQYDRLPESYSRIQKRIVEQLPVISLYFQTAYLMTSNRVYGVEAPRELNIYRNIEDWYLHP
ncbi:MAG: peptide ABC transporter substrate-binding protein [Clostridiales bacterium]|jgi:peptide/nickel transport system substrate-binding protein|nr:peptide ABC transporter substrate-binding protein [Clostridiales bacterium]